jgi:agmatinase
MSGAASASRFLQSELPEMAPENARFHVLPVPYEKTVSYGGGTAKGPAAIIAASSQLERWDGASDPGVEGIYTWPAIDCSAAAPKVIEAIAAAVAKILALGKMPVVLGGEHTVTGGVIRGYLDAGVRDFGVMRRVVEAGLPLVQLGNRAYCEEEREARTRYKVHAIDADQLVPQNVRDVALPPDFPPQVFFTLDVDGMDPSVLPATGTPVPGGLGWYQTLGLFESVARQRRIIGFDILEFAPIAGFHAYDFAAALLAYKLMGIVQRASPGPSR